MPASISLRQRVSTARIIDCSRAGIAHHEPKLLEERELRGQ
jgi:hypothetical protein